MSSPDAPNAAEPLWNASIARRLQPLGMFIQRERCERTTLHRQPGIEIHITDSGRATFCSAGQPLRQAPRSVVITRGDRAHQVLADPQEPYQRTVICIDDKATCAPALLSFDWIGPQPHVLWLDAREYLILHDLGTQWLSEQTLQGDGWEQLSVALAVNMATRLRRIVRSGAGSGRSAAPAGRPSDLVVFANEHVERHLADDLSLGRVARHFRVSPEHLTRSFQRHLGVPFHRYVVSQRIARAKALLRQQPDRSLTELAFSLGFNSSSSFSRTFRQLTQRSPSEYRLLATEAP